MPANGEAMGTGPVTEILAEVRQGTPGAQDELYRVVYRELRSIAAGSMKGQPRHHTLQPTALVHEAFLRLVGGEPTGFEDRAHFLGTAALAMRSVLIDHARARRALKRGGERARLTFDEGLTPQLERPDDVLAVHDALEKLEGIDAEMGRVVELRFFGGLTVDEAVEVTGIPRRTFLRIWEHARAWLYRELTS